jgi:hypothetical protein
MRRRYLHWMVLALVVPGILGLAGCCCTPDDPSKDDGTQPPEDPILIITPGSTGGWGVKEGGTLRAATFGDDKVHARFYGDHELWGKYNNKWYRVAAVEIELDDADGTVIKASSSNGLVAWMEDGAPYDKICGYGCSYDFPTKWGSADVKEIRGSGMELGSEQILTEFDLDPR